MDTYILMEALRGNKDLVLADTQLFRGDITQIKIVKSIEQLPVGKDWRVIAYKGFYTYDFDTVLMSHMSDRDSRLRILTTDCSIDTVKRYMQSIKGYKPTMSDNPYEIMRQLVGRAPTATMCLLWMLYNNSNIASLYLDSIDADTIFESTKCTDSYWNSYDELLNACIYGIRPGQMKLLVDAVSEIVDSSWHSKACMLNNAATVIHKFEQEPKKLLPRLLCTIRLLNMAERR